MDYFESLRDDLTYLHAPDLELIHEAYILADAAHQDQKRLSGEPYIMHPVAVTQILSKMHMDVQTLMAGLLHDVIEDTPTTKDMIEQKFGADVAELVDGVSKLTQIKFKNKAEAQAENFRKMLMAMSADIRVIIIKLADRLHNMRTLDAHQGMNKRRIAQETLDVYSPIAKRLGMHDISLELENLCFQTLYPRRYSVLAQAVLRVQGSHEHMLDDIKRAIIEKLVAQNIPYVDIYTREKHLYSIYLKMRTKRLSFTELTDVYALRVIADSVERCYSILGIVHGLFKPVPQRFKDYIALPKANGYQSLHTVLFGDQGVPIEVQIRTREMDQMAHSGLPAHWIYKSDGASDAVKQVKTQKWLENLMEIQKRTGSSLEFMEHVKINLFPEDVYVFTPKGKILELPMGSTAIDFAYAVHTEIGNTCVAAHIDRQLAPLSTVLLNGQTVQIVTAAQSHPNSEWLNIAVTGKAKSAIRHYLKTQQRTESVELGRRLLKKVIEDQGLSSAVLQSDHLLAVSRQHHFNLVDDILEDVGIGNCPAIVVVKELADITSERSGSSEQDTVSAGMEESSLLISGTEGMVVMFAKCCNPIPGDPIVGWLSAGSGLIVHMEPCHRILKLREQQPEKTILLSWTDVVQGHFSVYVEVIVEDRRGTLAMMTLAVSEEQVNISDISSKVYDDENHSRVLMRLEVTGRTQLARVIRVLRRLHTVVRVARVRDVSEH